MINFDQLYARQPYASLTGTEIVLLQGPDGTGGSVLNTLKAFFKAALGAIDITDSTTLGRNLLTVADLSSAKTLLEIPDPAPAPNAPVTLSADTTLDSTKINRRVFVDTTPVVLTLDSTALSNTDTITITNISTGDVTLNAGAGEDMIVWGAPGTTTTYTIPSNYCVRAYLVDTDTWFIEY